MSISLSSTSGILTFFAANILHRSFHSLCFCRIISVLFIRNIIGYFLMNSKEKCTAFSVFAFSTYRSVHFPGKIFTCRKNDTRTFFAVLFPVKALRNGKSAYCYVYSDVIACTRNADKNRQNNQHKILNYPNAPSIDTTITITSARQTQTFFCCYVIYFTGIFSNTVFPPIFNTMRPENSS